MSATILFLGMRGQEYIFIILIILLLFGGKKIPELMRGLGKGVKSFKEGINGVDEEVKKTLEDDATDKKKED